MMFLRQFLTKKVFPFFQEDYSISAFIHDEYDPGTFLTLTMSNLTHTMFEDKFTVMMDKQVNESIIGSYVEMQTTYGTTRYAMSTNFVMKNAKNEKQESAGLVKFKKSNKF